MKDCNINAMDAMHIAIALDNLVDIFLTTDDNILSNAGCKSKYGIEVKNPSDRGDLNGSKSGHE